MKLKKKILVAASTLLAIAACGGRSGTIQLTVVTSPANDPFATATQVRVTDVATGATMATVQPVTGGHFSLSLGPPPNGSNAIIRVEALDAGGNVLAWGQTPQVLLQAVDQGPYSVWVAPALSVEPAATALSGARTEMAATNVTGLGVLYAGGRDASGTPLSLASVYDVYTQSMLDVANMIETRAGAVATPISGLQAVVFGGSQGTGLGNTSMPLNTAELFDPTVGQGLWSAITTDPSVNIEARSFPAATATSNGAFLIVGGYNENMQPESTAAFVATTSPPALANALSNLLAPRVGAVAASATFTDTPNGAVVFGGLAPGAMGLPVAERLGSNGFVDYSTNMPPNRIGAQAVTLPDGRILVAGGKDSTGKVLGDGFVITPTLPNASVMLLPGLLSSPRVGHSMALTGNDVVVCGGADQSGMPVMSCDVIDATLTTLTKTIPTSVPRIGGSATTTEIGIVIIAGGVGADGAPLAAVDIFTPEEPALPATM